MDEQDILRDTSSVEILSIETPSLIERTIPKKEPFLKKPFDIFLAGSGLIITAWLWVLIWILILMEDGYPVFIKQKRIGKNGEVFVSFKFRSMIKSTLNEKVNNQAVEDDKRVTKVGRILRKTALDELPQLISIFTGHMSFVGPRPLLPRENEINGNIDHKKIDDISGYRSRIMIRPGLTGLAQVYAARDIPRRFKFKYDSLYVRKMGFFLDAKLILLSFLVTFLGRWEKRSAKLGILVKGRKSNYW